MIANNMEVNKYKMIDNFISKVIPDKKYLRHSDIDLTLNFTITGLLNYSNLLNEEDCAYINENFNKNYKYVTEIEHEKTQFIEDLKKSPMNKGRSSLFLTKEQLNSSLLNFKFPQFEIYFMAKLYVNGVPFEPEYITEIVFNPQINQTISLRYKYKDLTPDSCVAIGIYSMQLPQERQLLASTTVNIFDENYNLTQGKHVFHLYPKVEADFKSRTKTPGRTNNQNFREVDLLISTFYNSKSIVTNKNYMSDINSKQETSYSINQASGQMLDSYSHNFEEKLNILLSKSDNSYIELVFPSFNCTVVYDEDKSMIYKQYFKCFQEKTSTGIRRVDNWVCDTEIRKGKNFLSKDNPITEKFSLLSRISDDAFARDIRPTPYEAGRIDELLNTPDFIKLEDNDVILFWKYRYDLLKSNRKYSLTKILNAVKWGDVKSENEFIKNILNNWTNIEICDILYMLSYKFCINTIYNPAKTISSGFKEVRLFAVKHLAKLEYQEINFILLQLVQALRYEDESNSPLRQFLITRCGECIELATSFFWFLRVEADDNTVSKSREANKMVEIFKRILSDFYNSLEGGILEQINSQISMRDHLIKIFLELSKAGKVENKRQKLVQIIKKDGILDMHKLQNPYQLPIDPNIRVNGTIVDKCRIFASAKCPVKFTFTVTNESQGANRKEDPSLYDIMFKFGDDLRQDQLILQLFSYMDNLLKRVHLDFEFTTYKVLATSKSDGFVEFVPNCSTIYDILKKYDDQILPFLRQISEEDLDKRLDSFINSCAGYCVVTYILGIGDRHLENLLIDKKGRLFHIDFGYILGKDPKLYPPPMKLCKQMVECMGGKNSKGYEEFKKKCVDGYIYLRNNARLIVNMFYLMIHCGINELNENPEQVLNKLHDKFVPNLNPQEASNSLLNKLEESVSAFYPYLMEKFHGWANYWK